MRILERIRKHALEQPAKIALRNELNEQITYKQLYDSALKLSGALKRHKGSEKSAAILCRDPIQMAIGVFGTWLSNRPAVPLRKGLHENTCCLFVTV